MTGTTTIQDEVSKLIIGKKDITGKQEVTGATLTLTLTKPDESGATLNDVTVENNKNITVDSRTAESITWISGKTDAILSKLPDGKYTLKETGGAFTDKETGKTYTVIESTMTFTVENGVVTKTTGTADNLNDKATEGYYYYDKTTGQILVCDAEAVNVVTISKQDAASGAEVAGATLEITAENVLDTTKLELSRTDKNGNKTVLVKGTDYSISADGKTIQFVSGEDATIITGLPAGSYQLKETNAPDGYQLYTAEETFTIGTDGKVTGTTTIQDEVSKLTIGKKDITGKQEVTGAKLTLTLTNPDESGATLDGVTVENITADSRTADSITWTSGKTDAILSKLPDGKYTLKETGGAFTDKETGKTYTVIESTMTFTVENGVVTKTTGTADNLNDKATEGYYYYDKTTGQILVCDAEQPAVTTTPTSETTTTKTTTTTTTTTSGSNTTSDTKTTMGTGTVTTVSTVVTASKTSAGPTTVSTKGTTTEVTTGTVTVTSAGPTTVSTKGTTTEVTTGTVTVTSAGPTTVSTKGTTTEVTTGTVTVTSAGPTTVSTKGTTTEVTTGTTLATSGTVTKTSAGSTSTSTSGTAATTSTTEATVTTTVSASTETSAGTTTETVSTTAEKTTTTTTSAATTTAVTTTEQPEGYLIRKCDAGGSEIAGASLNITDQNGNVIDQWISEEGVSHVFAGIQANTPYCLTETLAPADYLVAEPIYFQLNEDGTLVLFAGVSLNADGSWSVENAVATANPNGKAVVMIDEYVGTGTTTTETTEETTTTTAATTTTAKNTTAGNGEHTPTASTAATTSTETTTVTVESGTGTTAGSNGSGTTTAVSGSQTTTVIRSNSGSSSSGGRNNTKIFSAPKTDDALPIILIPAGIALAAAFAAGCKRKKK